MTDLRDQLADHAFRVGDWVNIIGRVVELHPNDIDLGVELFSKTDQYKAFVRYDLCAPTAKPIPAEPGEGSVALVLDHAYQRVGEWWQPAGQFTELTWEQVNGMGDVEVIHDA